MHSKRSTSTKIVSSTLHSTPFAILIALCRWLPQVFFDCHRTRRALHDRISNRAVRSDRSNHGESQIAPLPKPCSIDSRFTEQTSVDQNIQLPLRAERIDCHRCRFHQSRHSLRLQGTCVTNTTLFIAHLPFHRTTS